MHSPACCYPVPMQLAVLHLFIGHFQLYRGPSGKFCQREHSKSTRLHVGVSLNGGTPKSSILIGSSIINHPFWGTTIFGNIHVFKRKALKASAMGS